MPGEWRRAEYSISTDKALLDLGVVHGFLARCSYWSRGASVENVRRRIENSLVFGLYRGREQAGFARVLTDYASAAYLSDVFVLPEHRGRGLGGWLVGVVLSHPDLEGLRWRLATDDAQGFYRRFGFTELERPCIHMERRAERTESSP